jgi:coenzyme PQQ precursor peptide PqqA
MIVPYRRRAAGRETQARRSTTGARIMKWETPQATDFRFGMEITMYIANR